MKKQVLSTLLSVMIIGVFGLALVVFLGTIGAIGFHSADHSAVGDVMFGAIAASIATASVAFTAISVWEDSL